MYNHCTYTLIIIKIFFLFFFTEYKNIDKKTKKSDFYIQNRKIFNINDINTNTILVSKKETYVKYNSFKYFISDNDNDVIRPIHLFILQTTGYINKFDKKIYNVTYD